MATDRREIARAIEIVEDWRRRRPVSELESTFIRLMDLDQSTNADRWQNLRRALTKNEALGDPEVLKFLEREDLAAEGYWWYDPNQWAPVTA
jgi:hypothetical protein